MKPHISFLLVAVLVATAISQPAEANVQILIQIEQVIGGVDGDTGAQAIQLRLRFPGESALEFARLRAWDAAGQNPITLIDFTEGVSNGSLGARVLISTFAFTDKTQPLAIPDFIMTDRIPDAYLAAGRITYELDNGDIYWSLAYGGNAYTGSTTGQGNNDDDGDFGPPYPGPLPTESTQALRFNGSATDRSTSNAADYSLTADPTFVINNATDSFFILGEASLPAASTWGLVILSLLLLIAGSRTVAVRQCCRHRPH